MRTSSNMRVVSKTVQFLICLFTMLLIVGVHSSRSMEIVSDSQLSEQVETTTMASKIGDDSSRALKGEERNWYEKFQNGLLFFDGWKNITKEIVFKLPHEEKKATKNFLKLLGEKIGVEWSKDNNIRKIDTEMLLQWGENLKEILHRNPDKISETLRSIDSDVDRILLSKNDFSV